MFLEVVTLLILIVVVVSSVLSARHISTYERKNRELNRARDERMGLSLQRVEQAVRKVVHDDNLLDNKLHGVIRVVDEHSASVKNQMLIIEALVRSDVLSARREELIRTKELKVALERIVTLTTLSRQQPDSMYLEAIESVTKRIEDLEGILEKKG